MRLGWRNNRPNDFRGPDQRPLRDQFDNIQKFLTFPHVRVGRDANFNVGSGTSTTVSWTAELDDPFHLHQGTSVSIQVPREFDSWFALGVAGASSDFGGGAGQRRLEWNLNAAATKFRTGQHFSAVGVRLNCTLLLPVSKNDVLSVVVVNNSAGTDSFDAVATVIFLPFT